MSLSNLLLALGLSALGLQEYAALRDAHPGAFYHGHHAFLPAAQVVSYCINAPSFLLAYLICNLPWLRGAQLWFCYVHPGFYVLLFLFWWWVGWRLDIRSKPYARGSWTSGLCNLIVGFLSLGLLFWGIYTLCVTKFPSEWAPGGRAIPYSMLLWGIGLLSYSGKLMLSWK